MPLPTPKYDDEIWDGTTPKSRPDTNVFKGADAEIGNRHSSEIIALEKNLHGLKDELDILRNPGPANSVLGVKADQSGLEYKVFVAGSGMVISHTPESVTFTSTGGGGATVQIVAVAGETLALGDIVYISIADGKAYKAIATSADTSEAMGFCDKAAVLNDVIGINPVGPFTNPLWSLTPGTRYYLSPITAGAITATAPSTLGQHIVPLCVASDVTIIAISILAKIKL
jgi:hypothetical protein